MPVGFRTGPFSPALELTWLSIPTLHISSLTFSTIGCPSKSSIHSIDHDLADHGCSWRKYLWCCNWWRYSEQQNFTCRRALAKFSSNFCIQAGLFRCIDLFNSFRIEKYVHGGLPTINSGLSFSTICHALCRSFESSKLKPLVKSSDAPGASPYFEHNSTTRFGE